MRLSSKARSLLTRAYTTNRPIAVFQEDIERELIDSRLMKYTERPLMIISHDGKQFCRKRAENRDG
jgi:hypothetical protein